MSRESITIKNNFALPHQACFDFREGFAKNQIGVNLSEITQNLLEKFSNFKYLIKMNEHSLISIGNEK